jgi:hypothetical protein
MYFVGKQKMGWGWSKLYLYRKEFDFDRGEWYFEKI